MSKCLVTPQTTEQVQSHPSQRSANIFQVLEGKVHRSEERKSIQEQMIKCKRWRKWMHLLYVHSQWFLSHHLKDCRGWRLSNPPAKCQTEFWTECRGTIWHFEVITPKLNCLTKMTIIMFGGQNGWSLTHRPAGAAEDRLVDRWPFTILFRLWKCGAQILWEGNLTSADV